MENKNKSEIKTDPKIEVKSETKESLSEKNSQLVETKGPSEVHASEPIIQEREVLVKEVTRRGGLFNTGCGCRTLGCFGCLGLIFLCVAVIFVIINRPPVIWNPIINYMNEGSSYPTYQPITPEKAQNDILAQVRNVGQNDIYITQDQLTSLGRDKIQGLRDLTFKIDPEGITMFWKLDESDNPLIGEAVLSITQEGKLEVKKIGTERVALPEFMNSALSNLLLSVSDGVKGNFSSLISSSQDFKINEIKLMQGEIYINSFVNVSLFGTND